MTSQIHRCNLDSGKPYRNDMVHIKMCITMSTPRWERITTRVFYHPDTNENKAWKKA